ncbi:hypothetical protein AMTR_s00017p00038280 [Amborella trichopoda]|uniref:MULE transposase domain-containing protein n=1 Tax=Amborella trichopoda TaxID=13333 RepID=W1PLH8_AMBTC|nr:hypothetical protein AMTR_s00017p00038280 [Amborella trichopoda]
MFQIVFAVVENDDISTWIWFLECLKELLNTRQDLRRLTIISDRRKGLLQALEHIFPDCYLGFCVHYLAQNFLKQFKNITLVTILWKAAHALRVDEFEEEMSRMQEADPQAMKLIRTFVDRLMMTEKWSGILVPNAQKEIDMRIRKSRLCHNLLWVSSRKYDVVEARSVVVLRATIGGHGKQDNDFLDTPEKERNFFGTLEQDTEGSDTPEEKRELSGTPEEQMDFTDASDNESDFSNNSNDAIEHGDF